MARGIQNCNILLAGISTIIILMSGFSNTSAGYSISLAKDEIIENDTNVNIAVDEIVDTVPTFPGGRQKLMEWFVSQFQYPPVCDEIEGTVIVKFQIKDDGTIGDAWIERGVDDRFDKEVLRVIKTLPKFNPAMYKGKVIDYEYTLPISFKYSD